MRKEIRSGETQIWVKFFDNEYNTLFVIHKSARVQRVEAGFAVVWQPAEIHVSPRYLTVAEAEVFQGQLALAMAEAGKLDAEHPVGEIVEAN